MADKKESTKEIAKVAREIKEATRAQQRSLPPSQRTGQYKTGILGSGEFGLAERDKDRKKK